LGIGIGLPQAHSVASTPSRHRVRRSISFVRSSRRQRVLQEHPERVDHAVAEVAALVH
jgi:hypothetical protein